MQEPDHLHQITTYVTEKITGLEPGNIMFLPGGWNDGIGKNVHLVYVITRQDDGTYSFIVCNVGPGNEYHLSSVTPKPQNPKTPKPRGRSRYVNFEKRKIK